jgi:hypothetical protein
VTRDRTATLVVLGLVVIAWAAFGLTPFTTHTRLSPITAALEPPGTGYPAVSVTVQCEPLVRSRYRSYVAAGSGHFFLDPSWGPCHTRHGVSRTEWGYVLAFLMLVAGVVLVAPRRGVRHRSVTTS